MWYNKRMKTVIEKIDQNHIERSKIESAARLIKAGELVAFPTETVYGLGADALNPDASRRIYEAKGRPSDNPLIVHIADMADLTKITEEIPKRAYLLGERFWPGPLTMILKKNDMVPSATTGGLETVAVRMPNHPVALSLIRESTGFVAAPSANISGKPSPTLAEHVYLDMDGKIPMILDSGAVGIGIESTIVDFSETIPTILRPGYITKEMVQEVIGEVRMDPGLEGTDTDIRPKAPGMKYRHYAPKAELVLIRGQRDNVTDAINRLVKEAAGQGKRVGIIGTDETCNLYREGIIKSIGTRRQEDTIARHMYGILREFDRLDVDIIYSECFSDIGIGQAVMNRMIKASGHHLVEV